MTGLPKVQRLPGFGTSTVSQGDMGVGGRAGVGADN